MSFLNECKKNNIRQINGMQFQIPTYALFNSNAKKFEKKPHMKFCYHIKKLFISFANVIKKKVRRRLHFFSKWLRFSWCGLSYGVDKFTSLFLSTSGWILECVYHLTVLLRQASTRFGNCTNHYDCKCGKPVQSMKWASLSLKTDNDRRWH